MNRRSYWLDTRDAAHDDALGMSGEGATPTAEPANLPASADVAIVGAGLTGLCAALELAKRGARVVVIEAQHSGFGASSRNAGMVLTGVKLGPHELVAKFGIEQARALDAASLRAIDFVERIVQDERIECNFVRFGHLALASKPSHYEQFKRDAEITTKHFGRAARLVPRDQLNGEIGSDAYDGGLVDDASAGLNPARFVSGLARAALRAGATICERTRVLGTERLVNSRRNGSLSQGTGSRAAFKVVTERGALDAGNVIVATGAYTGVESPWLRRRVVPIGSYIIATAPLPDQLARELSPCNRMMYDSKRFLHYFRLTPDRRMLFGGRASFVPESERAIEHSAEILHRDMIEVFPQLQGVEIDYAWGGTIDFTTDMLPHAGAIDGIHYAAGYAGHGVALATYLGTKLAAAIAGESEDNPFMQRPFAAPPFGAHRIVPGVVPAVGAWYRFLDAVS